MYIHLQTARLSIRRFTAADEDNLVSLNSDPEVMRYITGGAETMTVNLASRRVLEKCGLTHIRTYFDEELAATDGADQGYGEYQLSRAQWEAASRGAAT